MWNAVNSYSLCQSYSIKCCQHLTHSYRIPLCLRISSIRCCLSYLSWKCSWSHLSTSHAICCIINKYDNYIFSSGCTMNCFSSTNCSKVTITLICKNIFIRHCSLCTCRYSRCSSMRCFNHITIEIIICHNRTSYRTYTNCIALYSHFIYNFSN